MNQESFETAEMIYKLFMGHFFLVHLIFLKPVNVNIKYICHNNCDSKT